jgi:hypothetical protein
MKLQLVQISTGKEVRQEDGKTNNFNFFPCPESMVERTFVPPISKNFAGKTNAVGVGFSTQLAPHTSGHVFSLRWWGRGTRPKPHRQRQLFPNTKLYRSAIQLFYPHKHYTIGYPSPFPLVACETNAHNESKVPPQQRY